MGYTQLTQAIEPIRLSENEELVIVEPVHAMFLEPNPTETLSTLHFELLATKAMVIVEVRDLQGELILEPLNRELLPGKYEIPIDLSFQRDGMYIVELIVDRQLYTAELWKEKF